MQMASDSRPIHTIRQLVLLFFWIITSSLHQECTNDVADMKWLVAVARSGVGACRGAAAVQCAATIRTCARLRAGGEEGHGQTDPGFQRTLFDRCCSPVLQIL